MKDFVIRAALAVAVALVFVAPLAARADLYINPKSGLHWSGGGNGYPPGCHHWGSSVRCERAQRGLVFTDPPYAERRCEISISEVSTSGGFGSRWHAENAPYARKCRIHWVNGNTIDLSLN